MKPSTVVTFITAVAVLAALVALLAFRTSPSKDHIAAGRNGTVSQTRNEAVVPVTGAGQKLFAPLPSNAAKGKTLVLQPAANVLVSPVYDSTGRLVSDPTGTMLRTDRKMAPVFDTTGVVVSDPSGTILNANH
jgi:hypothetical protein